MNILHVLDQYGQRKVPGREIGMSFIVMGSNSPVNECMLPSPCLPCLQGNHDGARSIFERALAIRKEKLGQERTDTMLTLNALKEVDESQ